MKKLKFLVFALLLTTITVQARTNFDGFASFYADKFEGRLTANGDIFSQSKMTCAHKSLPFGTKLKVTNLSNDKSVIVTVNDRGPYVKNREIDLSKSAAKRLNIINQGVAKVRIEIVNEDGSSSPIDEESLELSDVLDF